MLHYNSNSRFIKKEKRKENELRTIAEAAERVEEEGMTTQKNFHSTEGRNKSITHNTPNCGNLPNEHDDALEEIEARDAMMRSERAESSQEPLFGGEDPDPECYTGEGDTENRDDKPKPACYADEDNDNEGVDDNPEQSFDADDGDKEIYSGEVTDSDGDNSRWENEEGDDVMIEGDRDACEN